MLPHALIGSHKLDLDTPILCIDLDVMEANIEKMAAFMWERGKAWRPHEKCHKTPAVALRQLQAGAIGVTCAKVSEAEVMAAAGVRDILIASMVVGRPKWERLAALCQWAEPIVACDHYAQVAPLAEVCREHGVTCRTLIEVDIGLNRVGTRPGRDTAELALAVDRLDGVELAGIMGYEGHLLQVSDLEEKREKIAAAMQVLVDCRDQIAGEGLDCEIVSAGGTGSFQITSDCPGVTELQAGGGIFGDPFYQDNCRVTGLDYALSVLTTVVSRPEKSRAVLDAGRKTHHPDHHLPLVKDRGRHGEVDEHHPEADASGSPGIRVRSDAKCVRVSAEHCELRLSGESQDLRIGDKLELIPGYADFTTVLHDFFYGFRGETLEVVWPIQARGKLQ